MKKKELEGLVELADQMLKAALKVVGNQADRSLIQHINYLGDVALDYSNKRYS